MLHAEPSVLEGELRLLQHELGHDQSLHRLDPKTIPIDPARDDGEDSKLVSDLV